VGGQVPVALLWLHALPEVANNTEKQIGRSNRHHATCRKLVGPQMSRYWDKCIQDQNIMLVAFCMTLNLVISNCKLQLHKDIATLYPTSKANNGNPSTVMVRNDHSHSCTKQTLRCVHHQQLVRLFRVRDRNAPFHSLRSQEEYKNLSPVNEGTVP
jgi:hypothetical protein